MANTRTWVQYQFWLAAAKEKYGNNMLDWPRHIRQYHNNIRIKDDKPRPKQLTLSPYGNTGVTNVTREYGSQPLKGANDG